jgi:hypothetical protein
MSPAGCLYYGETFWDMLSKVRIRYDRILKTSVGCDGTCLADGKQMFFASDKQLSV